MITLILATLSKKLAWRKGERDDEVGGDVVEDGHEGGQLNGEESECLQGALKFHVMDHTLQLLSFGLWSSCSG